MIKKDTLKFNKKTNPIDNSVTVISKEMMAEKYLKQATKLHYKQKNYKEASLFYLKVIDLIPDHIEAINSHAQNLRLNLKNYSEAILYYSKVIDLNPKYEHALFQRGLCKEALGDIQGRIDDLSKLIDLDPQDSRYYISRARIKLKTNDYKGVIEDCTRIIFLNEDDSFAYLFRGIAKVEILDLISGIEDLEKAIEIEEKKSKNDIEYKGRLFMALRCCGLAKLSNNDFDGSLILAEKLVAFAPNNPQAYRLRADINKSRGDLEASKLDLDIFNKLNDEHFIKYAVSFKRN
jgi:tetratricopeptide (TPR) repeat protein